MVITQCANPHLGRKLWLLHVPNIPFCNTFFYMTLFGYRKILRENL